MSGDELGAKVKDIYHKKSAFSCLNGSNYERNAIAKAKKRPTKGLPFLSRRFGLGIILNLFVLGNQLCRRLRTFLGYDMKS